MLKQDLITKTLKSEKEIKKAIEKLALIINRDFDKSIQNKESVVFITLLKGGVYFSIDLSKKIELDIENDFITSKSYFKDRKIGKPLIQYSPTIPIENKHVFVIDDYVDSGETVNLITEILGCYTPKSISIVGLFGNPNRKKTKFKEYYCWEESYNGFLVGYGLDYEEKFRNLPFVAIIKK